MKTAAVSVATALAASACCIGPVVAVSLGASALTALSVRFEPFRPVFLTVTIALLAFAFHRVYRPQVSGTCAADGTCPPTANRPARRLLWLAAVVVLLLVTFPYYVGYVL